MPLAGLLLGGVFLGVYKECGTQATRNERGGLLSNPGSTRFERLAGEPRHSLLG